MAYMQSNLAFAGGIQELTVDEIGFVSGGFGDDFDEGFFESQQFGDWEAGKKKKKKKDGEEPVPEIPDSIYKKVAKKIPYVGTALIVYDIIKDIIDIVSD